MARHITVLFRRDPSRDRQDERSHFEGYLPCWPDGQPLAVGMDAFCKHGQRLLGLGKHLAGCREKLIKLICFPLSSREDNLNRIPGYRVRRFYIERQGNSGRIHFMDGTPTVAEFEIGRDEPKVLHWLGLPYVADGDRQWFDLAAIEANAHLAPPVRHRQFALEVAG